VQRGRGRAAWGAVRRGRGAEGGAIRRWRCRLCRGV